MNIQSESQSFNRLRMGRASAGQVRYIAVAGTLALVLMMLVGAVSEASGEFPLTAGVDPSGPVHGGGYVTSGSSERFALTSGVDPSGPVHGGGYVTSGSSERFALTSGVDPSGPVHGGGYTTSGAECLAAC